MASRVLCPAKSRIVEGTWRGKSGQIFFGRLRLLFRFQNVTLSNLLIIRYGFLRPLSIGA
jgi:hypothetical protein